MVQKRITLSRFSGTGDLPMPLWKDAISAIALMGYELYADEENLSFVLGSGDIIEEVESERK